MLATEILQSYLDKMGKAVMDERFEAYAAGVRLPLNLMTSSANLTIATLDDLIDGFDDFCDMIQSQGVTYMVRLVHEARFAGPAEIVGVYQTDLLKGTRPVVPTFYSKMWLGCFDGVWQATKIHNTTRTARWPILSHQVDTAQWPPKESLE